MFIYSIPISQCIFRLWWSNAISSTVRQVGRGLQSNPIQFIFMLLESAFH